MPHFPKPFFKKGRGVWYVEIDRQQINLGPDRDEAFRRYHEIMAKPKPAEKQNSTPAIEGPDGASVYVVGTPPNDGSALHAHMTTYETFMPLTGRYRFRYGRDGKHDVVINPFEMISMPPGVIRNFTNIEDYEARMLVIIQGEDENALNDIILPPSIGEEITERWGAETKAKIEEQGMLFIADEETADAAE